MEDNWLRPACHHASNVSDNPSHPCVASILPTKYAPKIAPFPIHFDQHIPGKVDCFQSTDALLF